MAVRNLGGSMIALPREAFQRIFPIEKKTQFRERRRHVPGGGEPDPERSDQGSVAAFGRRKGDTGRDRSPAGSKGAGGRGGSGQARYDSGLVSEAHREQI